MMTNKVVSTWKMTDPPRELLLMKDLLPEEGNYLVTINVKGFMMMYH